MADYEVLMAEADHFRVEQYKPAEAIEKYMEALAIGGSKDRHAKQMVGMCYQLKHEYREALSWYCQAREGASNYEDGNILRDMAEAYSGSDDFSRALDCIKQSLDRLPYAQYPLEHATTLGFLAQTELRMGKTKDAVKHYATSDAILSHESNRYVELYNKLHYANALSRNRQRLKSRLVAIKGFKLALKYGANAHRARAVVLVVGGYKADNYFRSKLHR